MELTYQGLGFLDVLMPEQKLAVEVGEVDGVEIDDVDVAESGEDEVLEQLAANAACTNHEDARLRLRVSQVSGGGRGRRSHLFDVGMERGAERLLCELVASHCEEAGRGAGES